MAPINRRQLISFVPCAAAFPCSIFGLSRSAFGQDSNPNSFKECLGKLSPSVVKSTYSSLTALGTAINSKQLTHAHVATLQVAYGTYIGNLAETGYYALVDSQLSQGLLQTSLSEQDVDDSLRRYSMLGLPTLDIESTKDSLLRFDDSDKELLKLQVLKSGLQIISTDAMNELVTKLHNTAKQQQAEREAQQTMFYKHTPYCAALIGLDVIAMLTGNIPAAAIATVALWWEGC